MAVDAKKRREIAFLLIFSGLNTPDCEDKDLVRLVMQELKVTKRVVQEELLKAKSVLASIEVLENQLDQVKNDYDWEKVGSSEKSAIYLAIHEIQSEDETPPKVSLSEAIRLCRKFGTRESAKYVNAILHQIYQAQEPEACGHMQEALDRLPQDPEVDPEVLEHIKQSKSEDSESIE